MTTSGFFDFQDPFDIMVGLWNGMTTTYDDHGHYRNSVASLVRVSWVRKGKLLRYQQQELADLDQVLAGNPHKQALATIISHDFDMAVTGKSCHSTTTHKEKMAMKGVETQPGTYLFHLSFPMGDYYNNQYFVGPNERHIIGPFVPASGGREFTFAVAQTFTRISYDPQFDVKSRKADARASSRARPRK
jgi:hypothetical protein